MRVVVTGGAGFIGVNFLRLSVPRYPNYEFLNLDALTYAANLKSLDSVANKSNYAFEKVDLTEAERVQEVIFSFRPNLVVHFAAESHVDRSIAGPRQFIRTNIEGTFNLLEAVRRVPQEPPLFHHVSTDEVYGSLGEEGHFTEETRYDPSSPYSASKAASDHLVRAYHRTFGLPVKISNCSNNYGPYQFPEKLIPVMLLNCLEKKPLPVYGQGLNVRDWLYVTDHCEAIWTVIERGQLGHTYNIGGNNEAKNIDLVRELCRIVAEEGNLDQAELEGLVSFVKDRPGHDLRYAISAEKIRRECGWQPKESLSSGLRKTVRWYLEHQTWVSEVRTGEYRRWMQANYTER